MFNTWFSSPERVWLALLAFIVFALYTVCALSGVMGVATIISVLAGIGILLCVMHAVFDGEILQVIISFCEKCPTEGVGTAAYIISLLFPLLGGIIGMSFIAVNSGGMGFALVFIMLSFMFVGVGGGIVIAALSVWVLRGVDYMIHRMMRG